MTVRPAHRTETSRQDRPEKEYEGKEIPRFLTSRRPESAFLSGTSRGARSRDVHERFFPRDGVYAAARGVRREAARSFEARGALETRGYTDPKRES